MHDKKIGLTQLREYFGDAAKMATQRKRPAGSGCVFRFPGLGKPREIRHYAHRLTSMILICLLVIDASGAWAENISAIWANTGEDKVARDELRASRGENVKNAVWDGAKIALFGGRNEVIAFNVILEAGAGSAYNVSVAVDALTGPSGAIIGSVPASGNGVFDWTRRNVELFYIRYLPIKGLSTVANETYDERLIPKRLRRPTSSAGTGKGSWRDRPDHDKYYPDIAVPLELVPRFSIVGGTNQSVWVDIYIPKTAAPGNYVGRLNVTQNGNLVGSIPIQLTVYNFTLPDTPSLKTMLVMSSTNINRRYLGSTYANPASAAGSKALLIRDRHFMLAHRHRISLIGDDPGNDCAPPGDQPCPEWGPRLDGSLFSAANGYSGPGVGVGNNVYSVGTYGSWSWKSGTEEDMHAHTNAWADWFSQNAPSAEYFLYLIDESPDTAQIENWSRWILSNTGSGRAMRSLATISLLTAASQAPSLDIPTTTFGVGIASQWQPVVSQYTNDTRKRYFMYNGHRPGSGTFVIEDDGVALRALSWAQYKTHINRWFYWESTYYNNYQGGQGETNVFQTAQTMGGAPVADSVLGQTAWSYGNGDGVLFYPGTDAVYTASSYHVDGPFASLRLKYWRRGIQDGDYLAMASNVNSSATQEIIDRVVPKVLWEYGVDNPSDPTYVHTELSWSIDPQVWEAARKELAVILAGAAPGAGGLPTPTLNLPGTLPVTAQIDAGYPDGYSIRAFEWTIVPGGLSPQAKAAAAADGRAARTLSTPSATAQLAPMNLAPGYYQISVMAMDNLNNISPPAQANVNLVSSSLSTVRIYPNPWRAGKTYGREITFDRLPDGAAIKIFTISGRLVKRISPSGDTTHWDLTNESGDVVGSGLYLYVIEASNGEKIRGKVAVMK